MKDIERLLTIEAILNGDTYIVNVADSLDMGDYDGNMNSISLRIAFMGKVVSSALCEHDNLKAELYALEAELDEKVRSIKGMKGEEKINKHIRRDPRWLNKKIAINEAYKNYLSAKYIVDAYMTFSKMIEVKGNNLRKFPDLKDDRKYFTNKGLSIQKRNSLTDGTDDAVPKKAKRKSQKREN